MGLIVAAGYFSIIILLCHVVHRLRGLHDGSLILLLLKTFREHYYCCRNVYHLWLVYILLHVLNDYPINYSLPGPTSSCLDRGRPADKHKYKAIISYNASNELIISMKLIQKQMRQTAVNESYISSVEHISPILAGWTFLITFRAKSTFSLLMTWPLKQWSYWKMTKAKDFLSRHQRRKHV